MSIRPIILAAGKGTRMGNQNLPKVLSPLNGRPIVSYLLKTVRSCGFGRPVLVVGFHADQVKEALGSEVDYVVQTELLGTGHAVMSCREQVEGTAETYLVMYGDHPLFTEETLRRLASHHAETGAVLTLATLKTGHESFYNFGRILRDEDGEVSGIREHKDCTPEQAAITEYNPGLYCFSDAWLWKALEKLRPNNSQGEYYLTDLVSIALDEGGKVSSVVMTDWREVLGINTPEQLAEAEKYCSPA